MKGASTSGLRTVPLEKIATAFQNDKCNKRQEQRAFKLAPSRVARNPANYIYMDNQDPDSIFRFRDQRRLSRGSMAGGTDYPDGEV